MVAIGRGRFREALTVPAGVTLWGSCTEETLLAAPAPAAGAGTLTVLAPGVELRNLRLGGAGPGLWVEGSEASVRLRDVAVEGAASAGIVVTAGASLVAEGLAVRDTLPEAGGRYGRGLVVRGGGRATAAFVVLERNREVSLSAEDGGTEVALTDAAILDTLGQEVDGGAGTAVQVVEGAHLVLERGIVERSRSLGVLVAGGGSAELSEVVVREVLGQESDGTLGRGLHVQSEGSRLEARRLLVDRCRDAGLAATSGAALRLEDAVVRDTACSVDCGRRGPPEDDLSGRGLHVQTGGRLEAERLLLAGNRDVGLVVRGEGTTAALADLTVLDMLSHEVDRGGGHGLEVGFGASVSLDRALFDGCRTVAVVAAEPGTVLDVVDLAVLETLPQDSDGFGGRGLEVFAGAVATFERVLVSGATDIGVLSGQPGTEVTGSDLQVLRTVGDAAGLWGRGLVVTEGGLFAARRVRLEANRDIGLVAAGEGTVLRLEDAAVTGTRARGCAETTCADSPSGTGAYAADAGHLELTRFVLAGSALCGLLLAHGLDAEGRLCPAGGTADLREGEISGSPIGVSLQTEGFDVGRLSDGVIYRDNGRDLDTAELPIPVGEATF